MRDLEKKYFSPESAFASATKSNISRFQTLTNLPKYREIAKLFAKVSYFKVVFC